MSRLTGRRVVVFAQGELAQSPRMLHHARALLDEGADVVLAGYANVALPADLAVEPRLHVQAVSALGTRRWGKLPGAAFLALAAVRAAWMAVRLGAALLAAGPADTFLVQNPPALPAIAVAWLAARVRRARLVIDWHGCTWAALARRLGERHPAVRAMERLEGRLARRADAHLAVSHALAADLARRWGIGAAVVHDRPRVRHGSRVALDRADVLRRAGIEPASAGAGDCAILACPSSWSLDEDMEMLGDALEALAREPALPPLLVLASGLGPQRAAFERRARRLPDARARVVTGWFPEELYRDLLAIADVGISVHRSATGFDLPMKVVDMLEACLPPLVFDYGPCLAELLSPQTTAGTFRDAAQLAAALRALLADFPHSARLRAVRAAIAASGGPSWAEEWTRAALPAVVP